MSAPLERETPGLVGSQAATLGRDVELVDSKTGHSVRTESDFTPTYSSWLSQVERWFALITERAIRRTLAEQAAQSAGGEGRERGVLRGRECFRAGLPAAETGARDK